MKKFRFPLRSVATVRALAELRAREAFSRAVQTYVEAEQHLRLIRERIQQFQEILLSARETPFRAGEQVSFLNALRQETVNATKAEAEVAKARAALETARQAWLESRRDVRVIENLETKARVAYLHEVEREDQHAMDDRTSAIAARHAKAS